MYKNEDRVNQVNEFWLSVTKFGESGRNTKLYQSLVVATNAPTFFSETYKGGH